MLVISIFILLVAHSVFNYAHSQQKDVLLLFLLQVDDRKFLELKGNRILSSFYCN